MDLDKVYYWSQPNKPAKESTIGGRKMVLDETKT